MELCLFDLCNCLVSVYEHKRGLLVIVSNGVRVELMMLRINFLFLFFYYDAQKHMVPLCDLYVALLVLLLITIDLLIINFQGQISQP